MNSQVGHFVKTFRQAALKSPEEGSAKFLDLVRAIRSTSAVEMNRVEALCRAQEMIPQISVAEKQSVSLVRQTMGFDRR